MKFGLLDALALVQAWSAVAAAGIGSSSPGSGRINRELVFVKVVTLFCQTKTRSDSISIYEDRSSKAAALYSSLA